MSSHLLQTQGKQTSTSESTPKHPHSWYKLQQLRGVPSVLTSGIFARAMWEQTLIVFHQHYCRQPSSVWSVDVGRSDVGYFQALKRERCICHSCFIHCCSDMQVMVRSGVATLGSRGKPRVEAGRVTLSPQNIPQGRNKPLFVSAPVFWRFPLFQHLRLCPNKYSHSPSYW